MDPTDLEPDPDPSHWLYTHETENNVVRKWQLMMLL